jgi:tRNA 2-thiouridine synthesizing protein A
MTLAPASGSERGEAGEGAAQPGAEPETLLDLRGLLCPLTWAKTRYALSRLPVGALLRVSLDHRPAVPDIKRNAEELGHEVASARETAPGVWELRLRRG